MTNLTHLRIYFKMSGSFNNTLTISLRERVSLQSEIAVRLWACSKGCISATKMVKLLKMSLLVYLVKHFGKTIFILKLHTQLSACTRLCKLCCPFVTLLHIT